MGDGADDAIDRIDDWSWGRSYGGTRYKTCRYCGENNLEWEEFDTLGWRLSKEGVPHKCNEYDTAKQEPKDVYTKADVTLRTFAVSLICGDTSGNQDSYLLGYVQAAGLGELVKQFKDGGVFVRIEVEELKISTVAQLKAQAKRGLERDQYR